MALVTLAELSTVAMTFQLLMGGQPFNLSGCSIQLLINDNTGAPLPLTGTTTIVDAPNGKVSFSPGTSDLLASHSPYRARFIVTDSTGKLIPFPNGYRDEWDITAK